MKRLLILLLPVLIMSCSGNTIKVPDEILRQKYNDESSRIKIASLFENDIADEKKILISVNQKSPEALELMSYVIPLLHDRNQLSISFWFLDGNSDSEILSFLKDEPSSPTAEELLFNTDPRITGYREYEEFLFNLKNFYMILDNPDDMIVGSEKDSFIRFSLFNPSEKKSDRRHYLLHSPLLRDNRKWELPFQGQLYFMMIHDWPLNHYSAITLENSFLKDMYLTKSDKSSERAAGSYLDGIILMGYPDNFVPFTPLISFINEKNIANAVKFYPGQLIREKTKPAAYLVNSKVERKHRQLSRGLEKIYSRILELEPYTEE